MSAFASSVRNPLSALSLVFTFLILGQPGETMADVAYTTFGSSDTFQSTSYNIGPSHDAFEFVSTKTGILESVDVAALVIIDAGVDSLEFVLWSDGGSVPGSEIWSGTVDPVSTGSVLSMTAGVGAPTLTSGTEYWMSARSSNGLNNYGWARNDQAISGAGVVDPAGGTTWTSFSGTLPAFRVSVAVPEPQSALALMGLGLWASARRRR